MRFGPKRRFRVHPATEASRAQVNATCDPIAISILFDIGATTLQAISSGASSSGYLLGLSLLGRAGTRERLVRTPNFFPFSPLGIGMSSDSQASRQRFHEQRLGIALSGCAHAGVLLVLSLIALKNPPTMGLSLTARPSSASQALLQIPEFELAAPSDETEDDTLTPDSSVGLNIEVVLPKAAPPHRSLTADIAAIAGVIGEPIIRESAEEGPANPTPTGSDGDAINPVAAKTVAAIQGKVGKAGGKQGEVQFALAWKNINDADLHVIAPSGEQISFSHRRSNCRGMLDVDMNVDGESEEPVENVRWLTGAPAGRYTVLVNLFQVHSVGRQTQRISEFELLATLGNETELVEGSVSLRDRVAVFRFRYISDRLPPLQRNYMLNELERLQNHEETMASPKLEAAKQESNPQRRDRMLNNIIVQFPHTDASIEARQLLGGSTNKR